MYQRMCNLELFVSRKKSVKHHTPENIGDVPVEEHEYGAVQSDEECGTCADDDRPQHDDGDDMDADKAIDNIRGVYLTSPVVMCSLPPVGVDLSSFLREPVNMHKQGIHAAYAREYFRCAPIAEDLGSTHAKALPVPSEARVATSTPDKVFALALSQDDFLRVLMT